jgi:hypothetical protein
MKNSSVLADHIMGAYFGPFKRESLQSLITTVLGGMMNDYKIWFA